MLRGVQMSTPRESSGRFSDAEILEAMGGLQSSRWTMVEEASRERERERSGKEWEGLQA